MSLFKELWSRLITFGFHLLYHQLAPLYDLISWLVSYGHWHEWQLASLPYLQGNDVLEIAHGPGHMMVALYSADFSVIGVDLSPQMSQLAGRRLAASRIPVSLLLAPAQNLPLASGSFDSVLATFPTDFIADPASLNQVHRVLREHGRLVLIPEARLTGSTLPVRIIEFLYRITGQRNLPANTGNGYSLNDRWCLLRERLREAGFDLWINQVCLVSSEVTVLVATKQMKSPEKA